MFCLCLDERLESALKSKEKGNALVAAKDYEKAQKKYDSVRKCVVKVRGELKAALQLLTDV